MPETCREIIKDGKPRFEVMVGWDRKEDKPFWVGVSLNTAREILANETAFREFVKKHDGRHG